MLSVGNKTILYNKIFIYLFWTRKQLFKYKIYYRDIKDVHYYTYKKIVTEMTWKNVRGKIRWKSRKIYCANETFFPSRAKTLDVKTYKVFFQSFPIVEITMGRHRLSYSTMDSMSHSRCLVNSPYIALMKVIWWTDLREGERFFRPTAAAAL